jgi:PIN domain nuclease of toxin-antitoxin system
LNIIIDTHIFLWAVADPDRLRSSHRRELETPINKVYVSSISVVELMIKASLGKLEINFDPVEAAEAAGFEFLDFGAQDAIPLGALPFHHKDPFDRMLIAQAINRGHHMMTEDKKFAAYECKLL